MSPRAIRHRIGQLLIAGFTGTSLPVELRAMGWTEASGDLDLTVLGSIARRG